MFKHYPMVFDPSDQAQMAKLEQEWAELSATGGAVRGCVGCVDGIAIRIKCPSRKETSNPLDFRNRKHFYALNGQAMCNANLEFTWCALRCAGGAHDAVAFRATALHQLLSSGALPDPYCIFGDAAYIASDCMVTPYSAKYAKVGSPEDNFNFYHSNLRIRIECSFGILVSRWGLLWRPLRCKLDNAADLVELCMTFHNICRQGATRFMGRSTTQGWEDKGIPSLNLQEQYIEGRLVDTCVPVEEMSRGRRRDVERSARREHICAEIAARGLQRPQWVLRVHAF